MVTFYGKYPAKVDDKGRLVFPAAVRRELPSGADMRFVIKKSIYDPCLEMYTFEEWTAQTARIREGLDFFNPADGILVQPFDTPTYDAGSLDLTPFVEYDLDLHEGDSIIDIHTLPPSLSFSVLSGLGKAEATAISASGTAIYKY